METHFNIVSQEDGGSRKDVSKKKKQKERERETDKAPDVCEHVKKQFTFLADRKGDEIVKES